MNKLVIANWKMNGALKTSATFMAGLNVFYEAYAGDVECIICPPFTLLHALHGAVRHRQIHTGGQYCSPNESGAYTGDVSASMLADVGCQFVLVGHSERRHFFHETHRINKHQCLQALKHGLTPILCLGEEDKADVQSTITEQLEHYAIGYNAESVVVAYEPVWAIGGSIEPDLAHIKNAISIIKSKAPLTRVVYGGSVNENNATDIMRICDGVLVGGASLDCKRLCKIIISL